MRDDLFWKEMAKKSEARKRSSSELTDEKFSDRETLQDFRVRKSLSLPSTEEKSETPFRKDAQEFAEQRLKRNFKVTEFVSANELATMMDVPVTDIASACIVSDYLFRLIKDLMPRPIVVEEFGYEVEFIR